MNLEKENMELKEMLAGAQLTEKNLEDYLYEICDIIHMQMPLKYQDTWVEKMIELGLYDPGRRVGGIMATNKAEAIHFMKIVFDWCSPQVARSMMDDLDFYIAETTDNESIKESIKMVRELVYARAEENLDDRRRKKAQLFQKSWLNKEA